jgi:hypothetical protein
MGLALIACGPADPAGPRLSPPASTVAASVATDQVTRTTMLLEEDFQHAVLNPLKWTVETNIPQGQASVSVFDGHAILVNRGYLVTVAEFAPSTLGGIRISGDWTFAGAADDFLQVLTRSNGMPDPLSPFGEAGEGIEFLAFTSAVFENPNAVYILGRGAANGTVKTTSESGSLVVRPGGRYHFEIADEGTQVKFTVTDAANPAQSRVITATSPYAGAANHVLFHNRELCCLGTHKAWVDNLRISSGVN